MNSNEEVCINKQKIVQVLLDINTIVVSLARIGSSSHDIDKDEYNQIMVDFIHDWNVFRKLSNARTILSEPFSTEVGEDGMDELERQMQDLNYWRFSKRKP